MTTIGNSTAEEFEDYLRLPLHLALEDDGSDDWRDNWIVDGRRATITNTPDGMIFEAGPEPNDASHAVLWTKRRFTGDMKVSFEFTRLDHINRFVNILYFQANGIGEGEAALDIHSWGDRRSVPSMATYFRKMDLLHVSYAAFGNDNDDPDDYIRIRRYPVTPERSFGQIEVEPTIFGTGFFQPDVTHQMCFVKTNEKLALRILSGDRSLYNLWDISNVTPTVSGPLGIRHMHKKRSRYKNIRIYSEPAGDGSRAVPPSHLSPS